MKSNSFRGIQLALFFTLSSMNLAARADDNDAINEESIFHMAALGDSITRGYNTGGRFTHVWNSWSTGMFYNPSLEAMYNVVSHAVMIQEQLGVKVRTHNKALSGARSSDLGRQVRSLKHLPIKYSTLLIGANDLCVLAWSGGKQGDLEAVGARVEGAIAQLAIDHPGIKVRVVPVPDLVHLRSIGLGTSCEAKWKKSKICPNLLDAELPQSAIDKFSSQWMAVNRDLASAVTKFPDTASLASSVQTYKFVREDLSDIGCFHPSIKGQNILSRESFDASLVD